MSKFWFTEALVYEEVLSSTCYIYLHFQIGFGYLHFVCETLS